MTALEASSVRVRTMADGTLRAELDFEPRFAAIAFKLLGSPGQAVAVAALKTKPQQQADDKPKGGAWAQWLGVRCSEEPFRRWLAAEHEETWRDVYLEAPAVGPVQIAAETVRRVCEVDSRALIDNDAGANERFQARIRGPWAMHYQGTNA
jgi:hypothetical protein